MGAVAAEGEVSIRIAGDVEDVGIVEDRLVPIGRRVPHADVFAGLDLHAGELEVRDRGPRELQHG